MDSRDEAVGQAVPQGEDTTIRRAIVGASVGNCAYTTDAGAIMIEDLLHVLPEGVERLHRLPHGLTIVS